MKNIRGICALCRKEQVRTSTPSLTRISFDTFTTSKHNASKYIHMGQQQHFCIHFLLNLNLSFVFFLHMSSHVWKVIKLSKNLRQC